LVLQYRPVLKRLKFPVAKMFVLLHSQTYATLTSQLRTAENMTQWKRYQCLLRTTSTPGTQPTAKEEFATCHLYAGTSRSKVRIPASLSMPLWAMSLGNSPSSRCCSIRVRHGLRSCAFPKVRESHIHYLVCWRTAYWLKRI
jgi:hypothetical protein